MRRTGTTGCPATSYFSRNETSRQLPTAVSLNAATIDLHRKIVKHRSTSSGAQFEAHPRPRVCSTWSSFRVYNGTSSRNFLRRGTATGGGGPINNRRWLLFPAAD